MGLLLLLTFRILVVDLEKLLYEVANPAYGMVCCTEKREGGKRQRQLAAHPLPPNNK